jgi:hypothetical protein
MRAGLVAGGARGTWGKETLETRLGEPKSLDADLDLDLRRLKIHDLESGTAELE